MEVGSGHPLSVFISNPERKKERTDSDANDRELHVAGLARSVTKDDLMKVFITARVHFRVQSIMLKMCSMVL